MITLEINAGMASQYFITDPDKIVAVEKNPYIILANKRISIKEFSECFVTINNNIYPKKIDALQFEAFIDDLINEKRPSGASAMINAPLAILANGIDHKPLISAKVLKLRGIYQLLLIDISAMSSEELILRLSNELKTEEFHKQPLYTIYKPPKRLSVVSGLAKTVISTEYDASRILKEFPALISKDKSLLNESLM